MSANPSTSTSLRNLLLPSVVDLIFILLLVSLTYGRLAPRLLADGDVGWHIRNGENILATHAIPHTDPFSATMSGRAWYSWEWLYDLCIGWVHVHLGLNGVVFVSALLIGFTLAWVFRIALQRGAAVPVTVVIFAVCLTASSIHFLARPHLASWAFAVTWFWALDRYERGLGAGLVWFFPSLMMVWVNLHGGFVLGFVLLGIFLVAAIVDTILSKDSTVRRAARERTRAISFVAITCGVASLINPYSYRLHEHVYEYLTNRFYMQHIDEFRAPNIRGLPAQAFVVLVLIVAVGIWTQRKTLRVSTWLIVIFCVFSGLWAARNIPISALLLLMLCAPLFPQEKLRLRTIDAADARLRGHLWPALAVVVTLLICLAGGQVFHKKVMDAHFDPGRFPVAAAQAMRDKGLTDPIFSLDSWGGYLIYTRYPEQRVFVDDRHDFYGEPFLRDYLHVLHVEPGWQDILNRWGVHLIVFPPKAKLSHELGPAGWTSIYHDETAAVYVRR